MGMLAPFPALVGVQVPCSGRYWGISIAVIVCFVYVELHKWDTVLQLG